ncbi:MAG: hypothetical protein LBU70_10230 [Chitinispirillales bacterium]|jgi:hypothetical protein|nr:hypothetical protein [Chitinispirillales bacterium]
MYIKRFVLKILFLLFLPCLQISAQLSTNETPIGFRYGFGRETMPIITMPAVDIAKLKEEDEKEEHLNTPMRFGFKHPVSLDLAKTGIWHTLEDGSRLCQLAITSPGADGD